MDTRASMSESTATLAIGLWTVSLISYLTSGVSWVTFFLIAVGGIFILFGLFLIMPFSWKQESVLSSLKKHSVIKIVKLLGWLLVLLLFGLGLVQSKVTWLIVVGLITMIIAFLIFYIGLWVLKEE